MSEFTVSIEARRVIVELGVAGHPPVARIMRDAGINRRRAKEVLTELVDLAWVHRQRGIWELQPEGVNAAVWYRDPGRSRP